EERRDLTERLSSLDEDLTPSEEALAPARRDAETQLADLGAAKSELQETKGKLDEIAAALKEEQERLAQAFAEEERMTAVIERQRVTLTDLGTKYADLRTTYQGLLRDIDKLEAWREWLTRGVVSERGTPILFGANQALGAEVIDGSAPVATIRAKLNAFAQRLDQMVLAAGAVPLAGDERAVVIGKPLPDAEAGTLTWASPEQVLNAIADGVREGGREVIVRAFSVMNTHTGEPVPVDFKLFHNELVFRRGEVLAETILDGRLSSPALMEALVSLLRDEVGEKARASNVMPRQGAGGSNVFGSPPEAVGQMSFEKLFAAINRLAEVRGPARVRAVAAADVWTIGPLEADLVVEPITPVPFS
ncbi:MAG: hypothetical protein MUQ26_07075, partial [Armatimonadetes bacterium]|nr:hypothetical protein [Armatimonadota bacterium]